MSRTFIPSIFLIAGCSMGAGALALPIIISGSSFIFASIFLCLTAAFSYFLASLSLNAYVKYKNGINSANLVGINFGNTGKIISMLLNGLLMYSLLAVYITGGADLFNKTVLIFSHTQLIQNKGLYLFLFLFLPVFLWGKEVAIQSNKFIFFLKLVAFLTVIVLGIKFINTDIFIFVPAQIRYIPTEMPVIFGCLAFQMLIPVIAEINAYDIKQIRRVLKYGLLLPLVLYISWIGVMLSLIPREGLHSFSQLITNHDSIGTMITYATQNNHIPKLMKLSLKVFSNVALLTSFLGIGIALYEFLRDSFKIPQNILGKIITLAITMSPPVLIAVLYPNGFVFLYQQSIILHILSFILPILVCLKQYESLDYKPGSKKYLYLILIFSFGIILCQLLTNLKLLPIFQ